MKTCSQFNLLSLIAAGLATLFAPANSANAGRNGEVIAIAPIVTNTNDSGAGSLRQALIDAVDGDMITFNIPSPPSTITLTTDQLTIDKNITISGPGANVLTVARDAAAPAFRIFQVTAGHTVTIEGLTISNGNTGFSGGSGIWNYNSKLTVRSCVLSGNSTTAGVGGGGILNYADNSPDLPQATLIVVNSTLSGNSATGGSFGGGGIASYPFNGATLILTVVNSTLSGNSATSKGGGIMTFFGNATVVNSTLSGNSSGEYGGGIYNRGALTVANSTLSGNSSVNPYGGGIHHRGTAGLTLSNTIIKTGASGVNVFLEETGSETPTSLGYNISSDNGNGFLTATGDQINIDPMLGPLQDNGGPTFTHAPLSNSPAIDRGKDIGVTERDQRGSVRPVTSDGSITPPAGGDRSDIGAVELPLTVIPIPTPPSMVNISGTVRYCSSPTSGPVPDVTVNLTGDTTASTMSDGSGNYTFSSLPSGGFYTVTPTKAGLAPTSTGITGVDAIATQRHFLNLGTPLSGCRLAAADVTGTNGVDGVDAIAIQRFFLGFTTGIANAGKYKFTPLNRWYLGLVSNQSAQNFDTLVFGDVASAFVHRPESPSQTFTDDDGIIGGQVPATVATVALPEVAIGQSASNFVVTVTTSAIDAKHNLVGFQGDFTFDQRVATFQSEPVQKAGLTGGNWNVSANVLPGTGPIRTLRISAYSNDFTALHGSGTLFELRMIMVTKAALSTQLIWAAPPDHFIFIDADLKTQKPGYAGSGGVIQSGKRE